MHDHVSLGMELWAWLLHMHTLALGMHVYSNIYPCPFEVSVDHAPTLMALQHMHTLSVCLSDYAYRNSYTSKFIYVYVMKFLPSVYFVPLVDLYIHFGTI
jgi:hypothetical protein